MPWQGSVHKLTHLEDCTPLCLGTCVCSGTIVIEYPLALTRLYLSLVLHKAKSSADFHMTTSLAIPSPTLAIDLLNILTLSLPFCWTCLHWPLWADD